MLISPHEQERLLIHVAAGLARERRARVEPDTFTVRIDAEIIEEAPATELPLARRYFLF